MLASDVESKSRGWRPPGYPQTEQREVVLIIGSVGEAGKERVTCICGFVMDEAGECPRCKLMVEQTARDIEARQEMREALFREVREILEQGQDESG